MAMPTFVLIHGAFRGGWAWEFVGTELEARGARVITPTLTGCEPDSERAGTWIRLDEWADDVVRAIDDAAATGPVIVVAHSQAGLPVALALEQRWRDIAHVVYLDAAVPRDGERGVDLNPPGVPAPPPDLDPSMSIPARPVGPEQGFTDPDVAAFVNARLVPTPLGPSLDVVRLTEAGAAALPTTYVFCAQTPATYPSSFTRSRLDEEQIDYLVINTAHDAPLTAAPVVAELLISLS